jgi:hypoxanthine phosphoribosyltransferase
MIYKWRQRDDPDLSRVIISADKIQTRVAELADQINHDFAGVEQLYMVGILKGAFMFLADITRHIEVPHTVDFMALSSYGKTTSSGAVRILMDLREPIEGQHLMIVEDIVDTGRTLDYLNRVLHSCVLVRKQRDNLDIPIEYLGFDIPDVWVVGYGLDFAEKHRTLPYIAELKRD